MIIKKVIQLSLIFISFSAYGLPVTGSAASTLAPTSIGDTYSSMYNPKALLANAPTAGVTGVDPNCQTDTNNTSDAALQKAVTQQKDIADQVKNQHDKLLNCLGGLSFSGQLGIPSLAGLLDAACRAARSAIDPIRNAALNQVSSSVALPGGIRLGSTGAATGLGAGPVTVGSTGSILGAIK